MTCKQGLPRLWTKWADCSLWLYPRASACGMILHLTMYGPQPSQRGDIAGYHFTCYCYFPFMFPTAAVLILQYYSILLLHYLHLTLNRQSCFLLHRNRDHHCSDKINKSYVLHLLYTVIPSYPVAYVPRSTVGAPTTNTTEPYIYHVISYTYIHTYLW